MTATDSLRYAGALFTIVVGAVHIQQYLDFVGDVPTIAELFVLNGVGAGVVAILLATRLRVLGALAGIGLSFGALVSIAIAHYAASGLFDYVEPTFRAPVAIAVIAEIGAILMLGAFLALNRRQSAVRSARLRHTQRAPV